MTAVYGEPRGPVGLAASQQYPMAKVRRYETTPNPDALKCLLDTPISDRPRSFIGKSQAEGDPIAGPMFARARLRAVLINTDWISINKEPDADWKDIKPIVEEVLAGLD